MFQSYQNRPDLRSRTAMTTFLTNHFRYFTMNSWNRSTSYANKVKLDRLDVPAEKYGLALDVIFGNVQCPDWDDDRNFLIAEFENETGYAVGSNGRSEGYLVIYEAVVDAATNQITAYPGRSIDQDEDFEDWSIKDIRDRVRLVDRFDKLCDDLRNRLVAILSTYETRTDVVTTAHEVTTLVPREEAEPRDETPPTP